MQTRRLALLVALLVVLAAGLTASAAIALDINAEVHMPDAVVGEAYQFQFDAEEGCQPYHFTFKAGTLPPGLTVEDDGKLVGTPTVAGTFVFWVELTDGVPGGACHTGTSSQGEFTLIVAPRVEITATSLPGAKAGHAYQGAVTATGGGSLRWTVTEGTLPPGLSLNPDTGTLSGTPGAAGTFPFTVKVADDKRRATQSYSFTVASPVAVAGANFARLEIGVPTSASIGSSGGIGPIRWSVADGALPAGLALAADNPVISGTPSAAGTFSVAVTATDSDGETANGHVGLTVARHIAIAPPRVAKATVGAGYRLRLAATGGVGARTWTRVGALPRGLSLTRAGTIVGTPRAAGRYRITVRATDGLQAVATRVIRLTVSPRA